jgi:hypothetical protein
MPALPNREQHEDALARALIEVYGDIQKAMQEAPDAVDWQAFRRRLYAAVAAVLYLIYLDAAEGMLAFVRTVQASASDIVAAFNAPAATPAAFTTPAAPQADVINQARLQDAARGWSNQFGNQLATEIIDSMAKRYGQLRIDFLTGKITSAEFAQAREGLAAAARATGISTTEVTRAVSAGEQGVRQEFQRRTGQVLVAVWNTDPGATATGPCPVCAPLDGQGEDVWRAVAPNGPPLHPVCACYLTYEARRV